MIPLSNALMPFSASISLKTEGEAPKKRPHVQETHLLMRTPVSIGPSHGGLLAESSPWRSSDDFVSGHIGTVVSGLCRAQPASPIRAGGQSVGAIPGRDLRS